MSAMMAYAANIRPVFTGKPEAFFFRELCRRLGSDPRRCVLLGDNLESDIAGARGVGMKTVLLLTGVTSREDAARAPDRLRPDWVSAGLPELL
jgi:4-nitrophenyl phosphatase